MMIMCCKFLTEVIELIIIWVNYEDKIGHYCVSTMGSYGP